MQIRNLYPLLILIFTILWSIDQKLVYAQSYSKLKAFKTIALKCESINIEPTELQRQIEKAIVNVFEVILSNLGFNCVSLSQSKRAEALLVIKITNKFSSASSGPLSGGTFTFSADCELRERTTDEIKWKKSFNYVATAQVGNKITVESGSRLGYHNKFTSGDGETIAIRINNSDIYLLTKGVDVRRELIENVIHEIAQEFRQKFISDIKVDSKVDQNYKQIESYLIATAIYKVFEEKRWEADSYTNIGLIYKNNLKNFDKALYYYQLALSVNIEMRNKKYQEVNFFYIGNLYYSVKNYLKAIEYYGKALNVAQEINYTYAIFDNLHYLGDSYLGIGKDSLASVYYDKAIKFGEESAELNKDDDKLVSIYHSAGDFHRDRFHRQKALNYYTKALTIYRKKGDEKQEASFYNKIGTVYLNKGTTDDFKIALSYFEKALETDGLVEKSSWAQTYIKNIATAYAGLKKYAQSVSYLKKFVEIEKELSNNEEAADTLLEFGTIYESLENYSQARECYIQAWTIYHEIGNAPKEASVNSKLRFLKN